MSITSNKLFYTESELTTIKAGEFLDIEVYGSYFEILLCTADRIKARINDQEQTYISRNVGIDIPAGEKATKISFYNDTGADISLIYACGSSSFKNNRFSLIANEAIVTRSGNELAVGAATVGTSAVAIVPADAYRTRVTVFNNGANEIEVGGLGVTVGNGLPVAAGGSLTLETGAALYGISAVAGVDVRYLEEKA